MVRKLISLFLMLVYPAMALGAGQKPDDVQPYTPVTISYASGITPNVVNTGTPPAYATMPANIPTSPTTGWVLNSNIAYCSFSPTAGDGSHNCGVGVFGSEAKFRSEANYTNLLFDDPIRNYKEPGTSHCHIGYGNTTWNAWTTYKTLRNRPDSTAAGGVINASGYWQPCMVLTNPFGDNKNYAVRPDHATFYYEGSATTAAPNGQEVYVPRGLRFVWGTNMDDPDDLIAKARVTAANAQTGTAGRYSYAGDGYVGILCNVSGETRKYLKNTDGTDPFVASGGTGGSCPSSSQMLFEAVSGACWDGVNLWSPTGYTHVIQEIQDNVTGGRVCPNNWYRIFKIRLKSLFSHTGATGATGYKSIRLSSDDMAAANAGHAFRNGESFHTDYIMGWDDVFLRKAEDWCIGVNGQAGHECNSSTLDATNRLITTESAPNGSRSPQIPFPTYGTASAGVMFRLPAQSNGPVTIHSHQ